MDDDPLPYGILDDYPGVDNRSCQLLGPTALVVQALMGVLVILSLVYKRHRETPKRPWRIWLFDVSKQVVGQMFVHGVNVFVSDFGSSETAGNACVFYFLNILIDTTLGVALIYLILHVLTYLFTEKFKFKGFESGVYGSPPSINYWARQAALYVLSLTAMKFLVIGLLALFPGIFKIGEWLLSWTWTEDGDTLQVVITMGIFPIIMNILQFWLIDSIVKASAAASVILDSDAPDAFHREDHEPLFRASMEDDDDDDNSYRPRDIENHRTPQRPRSSLDSHSRSASIGSTTPDEYKSGAASTSTQNLDAHSYPPSLSSSLSSSASSSHMPTKAPKPAKNLMKKKRRGPPAPLTIHSAHQPAVNSPAQPSAAKVAAPPRTPSPVPVEINVKHSDAGGMGNTQDEWAETWDEEDVWEEREDSKSHAHAMGNSRTAPVVGS